MWARNLLFVGLSVFGVGALALGLLSENRIDQPANFDPRRAQRDDFAVVVDQIDSEFSQYWTDPEAGDGRPLDVAPPADELTVVRRLSLGLTGTVPSLEEIRVLEGLPQAERVEWWVSRLLEDRRYADYIAERLARCYVGTENGPFLVYRRRRFVIWLSDRIDENERYDVLVRRLISDTGLWTDTPAVNFLTATANQNNGNRPDEIRLAARTARAFLGLRIDCVQCHDERRAPENGAVELIDDGQWREAMQSDFHQLAAFFSEARSSPAGIRDSKRPYSYQYLDAESEQEIDPRPPFDQHLQTTRGTRRQQLARWVTHRENTVFARATVNRVWALLFGRPLVEPVDNIPLLGPWPPGLETLADDFIQHGYNLRRLIRVIAASRVFQLDSRADFTITPDHEKHWAVFALVRLRPEQVAGSLIQACSLETIDASSHILSQLTRYNQQNAFVRRYGDRGEDEFVDRGGTLPQRLLLMNGNLLKERTKQNMMSNAATKIASLAPDDATAIETAYLAVLSRRPSPMESQRLCGRLKGLRGKQRQQALEDVYWILLNSTEFSWNH